MRLRIPFKWKYALTRWLQNFWWLHHSLHLYVTVTGLCVLTPTGLSKYISFPGQFCTSVGGLELIVINYVGILSLHTSRSHYPLFSYLMKISRDHILNLSQTICPSFWLSWVSINCTVLCQCKYLKICLFTIN